MKKSQKNGGATYVFRHRYFLHGKLLSWACHHSEDDLEKWTRAECNPEGNEQHQLLVLVLVQ
nr:MAG TPA: hypothetical protein [Caudoviricetes sp.]